ncbi:hypothetical protein ACVXG7_10060 [Enterobacter hormaechei]
MKPTYQELEAKGAALAAENAGLSQRLKSMLTVTSCADIAECSAMARTMMFVKCFIQPQPPKALLKVGRRPWRCLPKR